MADNNQNINQLLKPKVFQINEERAQTSEILSGLKILLGSSINAIKSGGSIENPIPDVLQFVVDNNTISDTSIRFLNETKKVILQQPQGEQNLRSALFPDDLVRVVGEVQNWILKLPAEYKPVDPSVPIDEAGLLLKWNEAAERRDSQIDNPSFSLEVGGEAVNQFSRSLLLKALENLLEKIEPLVGEEEQEYASVDTLIQEIKDDPAQAWNDQGKKLLIAFGEANFISKSVSPSNSDEEYLPQDLRRVLNAFYDSFSERIFKDEPEEPWNRVSQNTKSRLERAQPFAGSQMERDNIDSTDLNKSQLFIDLIDQIISDIGISSASVIGATEQEDEDEGGDSEVDETLTQELNLEDVVQNVYQRVQLEVWQTINQIPNYKNDFANLNDDQRTSVGDLVASFVRAELSQSEVREYLEFRFADRLNEETGLYAISSGDITQIVNELTDQFLENHPDIAEVWSVIPGEEEVDKSVQEEKERLETAVVPQVEPSIETTIDGEPATGEITKTPTEFARDTTTAFVSSFFPTLTPDEIAKIRPYIEGYLQNHFEGIIERGGTISVSDQNRLMRQLVFSSTFATQTEQFYQNLEQDFGRKLTSIGLDGPQYTINIQNTIDSLIILHENPREFLERLRQEGQLLTFFGVQTPINPNTFEDLITDYLRIRDNYQKIYAISRGRTLKPTFSGANATEDLWNNRASALNVREIISAHQQDGVDALQLTGAEAAKAQFEEQKRKMIEQFRRELWLEFMRELDEEERNRVYEHYEKGEIDLLERKPGELPVPDGFGYADLTRAIQSGQIDFGKKGGGLRDKLLEKATQGLGKAALTAVGGAGLTSALRAAGLRKVADWIEENAGKLVAGLAAGITALIGLLTKSVYAALGGLLGGITGGAIGTLVAPGVGTWIGAGIGTAAGTYIGYQIDPNIAGGGGAIDSARGLLGGSGAPAAASGAGALATATPMATQVVVGSMIGVTAMTLFTITDLTGSLIHPTVNPFTGETSKYVTLAKTPSPDVPGQDPQKITYTVYIQANKGYDIEITNVVDSTAIRFKEEGQNADIPDRTLEDFDELQDNLYIAQDQEVQLTYEVDYDQSFDDAAIVNTFTIDFNFSNSQESGESTARTVATVAFGDYPTFGNCWPVGGIVTGVPFEGHHISNKTGLWMDAIDIAGNDGQPIVSLWDGEIVSRATTESSGGAFGIHVIIKDDATGFLFVLAHFSSIESLGNRVSPGQVLGHVGSTGNSTGPHLHYEVDCNGRFYSCPVGTASQLLPLHQAEGLSDGQTVEGCYQ